MAEFMYIYSIPERLTSGRRTPPNLILFSAIFDEDQNQ